MFITFTYGSLLGRIRADSPIDQTSQNTRLGELGMFWVAQFSFKKI